ncbi:hypothetical protein ACFL7D_01980 [candidate division KSB1 bacterium]
MDNDQLLDVLNSWGFKVKKNPKGSMDVYHPENLKHVAVIEKDGSILLPTDIANNFYHLLPRIDAKSEFQYTWRGALRLNENQIAQKLLRG